MPASQPMDDEEQQNTEIDDVPFEEHVQELMQDLKTLFRDFSLESYPQSLLHVIEVLAHVTRTTSSGVAKTKGRKAKKAQVMTPSCLNQLAYELLALLLLPTHGSSETTFSGILKVKRYCLWRLLMFDLGAVAKHVTSLFWSSRLWSNWQTFHRCASGHHPLYPQSTC